MRIKVAVVGGGSWGTTVAHLASDHVPTVLWARRDDLADEVNSRHTNERYLPGHQLNPALRATTDLAHAVAEADVLVMGVPSQGFRSALEQCAEHVRAWVPVLSLTKGLEQGSRLRMTQIINEVLPGHPAAVLTGPNLAKEILVGDAAAAVIATLSLLVIAHTVFINWEEVTNGARTLFGVQQYTTLWNALAWALFFVLVAYWFKETATGLKLRASREEERAAAVMGVNIVRVRWVAWILSAFIVGVGGVLYAHFITSFSPVAFYLSQTFIIIAMLIIGGSGSVAGAVVGVVVVTLLTESLRAVENSVNMSQAVPFTVSGLSEMFVALAMILILIYRPAGIMRGREFVWPLWRARKEGDS